MKLIFKIIRKLKLSKAAFALLSPLISHKKPLFNTEEALSILNEIHPDPGNSCILPEPRRDAADPGLDLDIIIPCYNAEKFLHECIDSVLTQETKYRWRIIAIDDGSTDSTGAILDKYAEDCRILVKHQENRGFSGARNAGLDLSSAKYIYFLDSDDMLCSGMIEKMLDCSEANRADVVEGAFRTVDVNGDIIREYPHNNTRMRANGDQLGFPCGKVFRREVFSNICFPLEYWYEDSIIAHIIFPRLALRDACVWGCSACSFDYRMNPASISHTGRSDSRCLDALWIHLRMFDDRQKLGIPVDQPYYEYLLRMLVLTYHRTENLSEDAKRAVFTVWSDFFGRNLSGFGTEDKYSRNLEKAVRSGDYGHYSLFCALN